MNQEEIKAMKDHAANGGFTSPYKVSALIAEVDRLEGELHVNPEAEIGRLNARLETEILRRDSLGETLDNVVADHKKDIARLADIKAKAEPIKLAIEASTEINTGSEDEYVELGGYKIFKRYFRELAAALEGE